MGFFSSIKHKQIKSFTKGACRSMLASFLAFEDQMKRGKIEAKLFNDLVSMALSTRPGWKEIDDVVKRNQEWTRMLGAVTMRKMGYKGLK